MQRPRRKSNSTRTLVPDSLDTASLVPDSLDTASISSSIRNGTTTSKKNLPGVRSKWSTSNVLEKIKWIFLIPFRTLFCVSNVTVFFFAYFGFLIPVLPLKPVWPRLFWYCEGKLYRWLQAFIGYWGYTAGYDVYEYGDDITPYCESDRVLMMINHQSTGDVPTLLALLQSKGTATRKTLWLMDIMFRWTPFGIVGRIHGDYFIQQGKDTRNQEIDRLKIYLNKIFWERDRRWVILFPEGGFYYKRVKSSQDYGKKHGFPHLEHTTLPRMGAVKAILEVVGPRREENNGDDIKKNNVLKLIKDTYGAIREKKYVKDTRPPIKYVLDVTIAYPHGEPLSLATLIFGTREKCDIAVNYKMYNVEEVPFRDDNKLRDWMYKVYQEKDKLLDNYYKYGSFNPGETAHRIVFPWSKIIGQYVFWAGSFYVQYRIYTWLLIAIYSFFFPPL